MIHYKRVLILVTLMATGVPAAWSLDLDENGGTKTVDSVSKTIENLNELILKQSIFDNSCKNLFNKTLMPNLPKELRNSLEIIIISKRPLIKEYANVTELEFKQPKKGGIKPTLAEKFIETYSGLKFFHTYILPSDKNKSENAHIIDCFEYLDYMLTRDSNKKFIIYMDFNVKYEKNLCEVIKQKFKKFKGNSIIITNTELGEYNYDYTDLQFMIPAFIKDEHVFNVGAKEISLEDSRISDEDKKIILRKFDNCIDIKIEKPVSIEYQGLGEDVNMSEYAAFPVILVTAVAWLFNWEKYCNTEMVKVIKEKFLNNDHSINLNKALQYIERKNLRKEINFDVSRNLKEIIIYFDLNRDKINLIDNSNIVIKFNKEYDVKITKNTAALRRNKEVVKSFELNDITSFGFMTLKEGEIVFNVNNPDYKFENVTYGYTKINNILITQNNFANNFKNLYIREIKKDVNDAVENADEATEISNDVPIEYEKSVAVLFVVNKNKGTNFTEFSDNVQNLINTLSKQGFEIRILMGQKATLESLLELAESIKSKSGVTRLLFYYFGHMMKVTNSDFSEEYQLTCYTGQYEEDMNLLSIRQLLSTIKSLKFLHNCILIDSCEAAKIIDKPTEKFVTKNASEYSLYLITASEREVYARGLLADCFVKSLGDGKASLDVICGKMKKYANDKINELKNDKNLENRMNHTLLISPVFSKTGDGNFYLNKCNEERKCIYINGESVAVDKFDLNKLLE